MIVTVIPARLGSTRLPNKLILSETGRPLIHHTIDRALEAKTVDSVFVVTEDRLLFDIVKDYHSKVEAVMSGPAASGTERVAGFVKAHFANGDHTIVNLQGDEPELSGSYIDKLASISGDIATLASPTDAQDASNQSVVKVVISHSHDALWFSRYPIPLGGPWLKHIGIYSYSAEFLRQLPTIPQTTAAGEKLEQLQWLQAGWKIKVVVDNVSSVGIDTAEDYNRFTRAYYANSLR